MNPAVPSPQKIVPSPRKFTEDPLCDVQEPRNGAAILAVPRLNLLCSREAETFPDLLRWIRVGDRGPVGGRDYWAPARRHSHT
jgi:hypothetical protein